MIDRGAVQNERRDPPGKPRRVAWTGGWWGDAPIKLIGSYPESPRSQGSIRGVKLC